MIALFLAMGLCVISSIQAADDLSIMCQKQLDGIIHGADSHIEDKLYRSAAEGVNACIQERILAADLQEYLVEYIRFSVGQKFSTGGSRYQALMAKIEYDCSTEKTAMREPLMLDRDDAIRSLQRALKRIVHADAINPHGITRICQLRHQCTAERDEKSGKCMIQ